MTEAGEGDGGGPSLRSADLDEAALRRWGEALGEAAADAGVLVALYGPLGAGKTTLVQAALRGAGATGAARSPSYVLHRSHPLPDGRTAHHLDLYRIGDPSGLDDLGWDELLGAGEPLFVEWADRAGDQLPEERWDVRLGFEEEAGSRHVEVSALGGAPPVPDPAGAPPRRRPSDEAGDAPDDRDRA